jgi:Flp pilus assembly protein TadD
MHDKAIAEFQKAVDLSAGDPVRKAVLGHAYAVAGKPDEARKIINELNDLSKRRYFPPYFVALIYVGLGDKDQACAWLEKAFVQRSAGINISQGRADVRPHSLRLSLSRVVASCRFPVKIG